MATTTAFIERQKNPMVMSGLATIDINETATLAIPCGGRALVRLGIPSTFTGTSLTFTVQPFPPADPASPTADPPFRQLRDAAGNVVTATVAANRVLDIPELAGAYAFTIVSGSAEAAARAIEVQCVGPYPSSPGVNNVTVEGTSDVDVITQVGAANIAVDQVATATTAGGTQVLAARATRRSVTWKNTDTAITIYLGVGTLSSTDDSIPLLAGESITLNTTAAIKALSASGTPRLSYVEVYD